MAEARLIAGPWLVNIVVVAGLCGPLGRGYRYAFWCSFARSVTRIMRLSALM
jgi:hypothetical protein